MLSCSQVAGALSFHHNSESQNNEEGKPLYVHVFWLAGNDLWSNALTGKVRLPLKSGGCLADLEPVSLLVRACSSLTLPTASPSPLLAAWSPRVMISIAAGVQWIQIRVQNVWTRIRSEPPPCTPPPPGSPPFNLYLPHKGARLGCNLDDWIRLKSFATKKREKKAPCWSTVSTCAS